MRLLAGAILVVGLATVSVTAAILSKGEMGEGWGVLAFITLVFWGWEKK